MLSDLRGIPQPSERQFVIVDNTLESELPTQYSARIPLTMWVDYQGKGGLENPPSVTLLINPATMSTAMTKKINPSFTRGGFIVENWGDNLDVLSFSGTIGAYYVVDSSIAGTGLNRYDRSKSFSFRNLMEVFLVYRNNGAVFSQMKKHTPPPPKVTKAKGKAAKPPKNKLIENAGAKVDDNVNSMKTVKTRILSLGDVYLQYDRTIYMGSFDSFSIEEDATRPFTLNYNFSFTVLRKHVSDNRTALYYNQVALDFEDRSMSKKGNTDWTKASIQKAIETTKNSKDQESLTNPTFFQKNVSEHDVPGAVLSYSTRLLEKNGYTPTETQKAELLNSFKALNENQTYKENQVTKENLYKTNHDIVQYSDRNGNMSSEKLSSEQVAKEARDLSEAQASYAAYRKGAK